MLLGVATPHDFMKNPVPVKHNTEATKDFLLKLCSILNCQLCVSVLLENVWLKTKAMGNESPKEKPCPPNKCTLW